MKIFSWRHLIVYGVLLGSISLSGELTARGGEHAGGMREGSMGHEGVRHEGNFEHINRDANFDHFNNANVNRERRDVDNRAYDRGWRQGAAEGAAVEGVYGGYGNTVVVPGGQNLYDSDVNNDNVNLDDSLPNQQTPTGGRIINE